MLVRDLLKINQHLNVWCCKGGCRHKVRFSAVRACETFGPDADVHELMARLRCAKCGARGRDGHIDVHSCTLDWSAHHAREQQANAIARGVELPWCLDDTLARYARLIFETGDRDLGGDGPVAWPPSPA